MSQITFQNINNGTEHKNRQMIIYYISLQIHIPSNTSNTSNRKEYKKRRQ